MNIETRDLILKNKNLESRSFRISALSEDDLKEVMHFQDCVTSNLEIPKIFALSSEEEFLESMESDCCCGLYEGNCLAAVAIFVLNRESYRNLGQSCLQGEAGEYVTFDTIQVREEYRGYGIQKLFLSEAENIAKLVNAKYIIATVSPENLPSRRNFEEAGYRKVCTLRMHDGTYGNAVRDLMCKQVKEGGEC